MNIISVDRKFDLTARASMVDYQVRISDQIEDPAWDGFLEKTHGGHHVQTSLWAQLKASLNWRPLRIVITREAQIVAGVQVLIRPLPILGAVGYVSKGPIFASKDPILEECIVKEMQQLARTYRIQYLMVQPLGNDQQFIQRLTDKGFWPSSIEGTPTATVLLDLSKDLDTILAGMARKTRYNIRLGLKKGITVREGTEQDLRAYYRILMATGQRQNFSPYPEHYFTEMWRILNPHGYIKLFVAEFEGEIVSAQLAVPFGDTLINKLSVWSGQHGNRRPNEALQWTAIKWAKSQGYRYYDFEGIKPEAAGAILRQEPLPDSLKQTVTSFKLGFSDQVALFPGPYDYIYNPLYRWVYSKIFLRAMKRHEVTRILKGVRTGNSFLKLGRPR